MIAARDMPKSLRLDKQRLMALKKLIIC